MSAAEAEPARLVLVRHGAHADGARCGGARHARGADEAATFALEIAHGHAAAVRRHPGGWTVARLGACGDAR